MKFEIEETATGWGWRLRDAALNCVCSSCNMFPDEGACRRSVADFKRQARMLRFARVEVASDADRD